MTANYVHLHCHSEYSVIDGMLRIGPWLDLAASYEMPAVGISDVANIFGLVKFYHAAIHRGIKPVLGCDVYIASEATDKPQILSLYCQNKTGYINLTNLVSKAYIKQSDIKYPHITPEELKEHAAGLIAISSFYDMDFSDKIGKGDLTAAAKLLKSWEKFFPNRFYVGVSELGHSLDSIQLESTLSLASNVGLPAVATNNVCFLHKDDFLAHEARVCIHDGYTLDDPNRPKKHTTEQYFKSCDEMEKTFGKVPAVLANSLEIAKRCNLRLETGRVFLPNFNDSTGLKAEDNLLQSAAVGLTKRLAVPAVAGVERLNTEEYKKRLAIECKVINSMGFAGYFLIVADFITWAREHNIAVGPGRGSGAGSLVAYCLGITDIDPLPYNLLFERFLNPERVSMPDFDIDFCMDGRDSVIEYVTQRYGADSVSQIITFGTMAAKAVIRDIGRVLGHPYFFVDKIAKLIPNTLGITLDKALAEEEELKNRYDNEDEVKTLIDLAKKLEGITRNVGKHAGGVVIAPQELTNYTALYCDEDQNHVCQFDKNDVETIGLIKFDFLGLRTLTIITKSLETINSKLPEDKKINIDTIPLNDQQTFALLCSCLTTAVFQLESRGMKDLIRKLEPDCFEDIVALVALFRPGPLQSGMVDDFLKRKKGLAEISYPHPDLEPILKPTYGIILYQEQVMQIAQKLAGYTLGAADLLRRAMGKKKPEEMAKQRSIFVDGAVERGIKQEVASYIFDLMEKFAGYGFNKSHSAGYALISYQTAWLKTHFTAAFMAAVMSADMANTDKLVHLIEDVTNWKISVALPNINESNYTFTMLDEHNISYGLGAIKGVGESAITNIIEERKKSLFKDFYDFCARVDTRKVTKRALEALVYAGAFDCFNKNRADIWATISHAMQASHQMQQSRNLGQGDLFGESIDSSVVKKTKQTLPNWPELKKLLHEKSVLGFYLSGHPISIYESEISAMNLNRIANLKSYRPKEKIKLLGFVVAIRTQFTKKGDRMAFVTIDDKTGRQDIAIFSDLYKEKAELLKGDEPVVIEATVGYPIAESNSVRLRIENIKTMDELRADLVSSIIIEASEDIDNFDKKLLAALELQPKGRCPVILHIKRKAKLFKVKLGTNWLMQPTAKLCNALANIGAKNISFTYY